MTKVKIQSYAGVFLVALATLMYEILLTRIFSVTMWFHFAFMAISIAMFGMTVGAIAVYLLPNYFSLERSKNQLALNAMLFAITIVISFLIHLKIPFIIDGSFFNWFNVVLTYVVVSIPFIFSGICICLALTKFPRQISGLYAADLIGAALGCILIILSLKFTDGPSAVIIVAFLASISSVFFATEAANDKLTLSAIVLSSLLAILILINVIQVNRQSPLLRIKWIKGIEESPPIYEKWNSFSRITVAGNSDRPRRPWLYGPSPFYKTDKLVRGLDMRIDGGAWTPITAFNGDINDLDYLKYDLVNIVHFLRANAKVLIVGTGGGRDILSALAFKQNSILGVEINKAIIDAVNKRFGDLSGHLDRNPRVTFVNDEARSFITRMPEKFNIIQVSFIDTAAATAAGAYVLSENSLYTVEAWESFIEKLTPRGIITFSRWFYKDYPGEMYRITSLATTSLKKLGVNNPRQHIIILRASRKYDSGISGVGTILICKEPFGEEEIETIEKIASKLGFDIILSPRFSLNPIFTAITEDKDLSEFSEIAYLNVAASTDNNPFFFHMLRLRYLFDREIRQQVGAAFEFKAVIVLVVLLIAVVVLTILCIIIPLVLTTKKETLKGSTPLFLFFSFIGLGFMLVEISQMQRFVVFLGHPTYSLSVVLFALLLSSGMGSFSTLKIAIPGMTNAAILRLLLLICVLFIFGLFTPYAISTFRASTNMLRILVATVILFPLGFFMGMAFPLGIKIASNNSTAITPWLWGLNGATSICASVLAMGIALYSGISASFWSGFFCYLIAFLSFIWACRDSSAVPSENS